jgi:carbonic anhydrase/acetyltransferase-like protein (isoleucine patch superfamily)
MGFFRKKIKESDSGFYFLFKKIYYIKKNFSVPAPQTVVKPIRYLVSFGESFFKTVKSILWVTPLYKSYFEKVGKQFATGIFLPFMVGDGRIFVGDNVKIFGKVDFIFGTAENQVPEIYIGDDVHISHDVTFDVSGKLVIGAKTLIAKDVTIQDCSGHSSDPVARENNVPPTAKDIKPITIGRNVWICTSVQILPGVHIGDNSVIGAGTVLRQSVPKDSIVYSPPPLVKKYRKLSAFK